MWQNYRSYNGDEGIIIEIKSLLSLLVYILYYTM